MPLMPMPDGFDFDAWYRASREASGVPFKVRDTAVLRRVAAVAATPSPPGVTPTGPAAASGGTDQTSDAA